MTDIDIARAYIEFWQMRRAHPGEATDEDAWDLSILVQSNPFRALRVIKLISRFTNDKEILCVLGAGELVNLPF